MTTVFAAVGFLLAAYAIVANDAIQTLGTFLASNGKRPWWVLWLYAVSILVVVLIYGWWTHDGDVSYGRLAKIPEPDELTWIYVVPPLVLLGLTRSGIPVSTTFLILTIFKPSNLPSMVVKSGLGYAVAFAAAIVLYLLIARAVEAAFLETADAEPAAYWVGLQWLSTGFLWSQWLIQDLANIFVYLPRRLTPAMLAACIAAMLALHAYTFYTSGGAIQRIVTSKTNTEDIRSATIIDFVYGVVLFVFKEWSHIPMSTTWVFLGLLAGRELALTLRLRPRPMRETAGLVLRDAAKALAGLVVSVVLALGLPVLAGWIDGVTTAPAVDATTPSAPSENAPAGDAAPPP